MFGFKDVSAMTFVGHRLKLVIEDVQDEGLHTSITGTLTEYELFHKNLLRSFAAIMLNTRGWLVGTLKCSNISDLVIKDFSNSFLGWCSRQNCTWLLKMGPHFVQMNARSALQ